MRILIDIESPADEDAIRAVVEKADKVSPWLANFTKPIAVTREVTIKR